MRDDKPYPNSGKWLREQSDDQLQYLVDHSFPGSPAFDGPAGELQRRKTARSERRQLIWIKLTLGATVVLGVASIVVAFLTR